MESPIAYLITWTTYGSWLHGDPRGSFDSEGRYIQPDPVQQAEARESMAASAVALTDEQRAIVDQVIADHSRIRGWVLHAKNVRTCHVHVVVSANIDGEAIREQLKLWASRRLSAHAGIGRGIGKDGARRWWTEKGNVEPIWNDAQLAEAIRYVNEQ